MKTNNKLSIPYSEVEKELMEDKEFLEESKKLDSRYEVISAIINLRKDNNMTQKTLADLMGTKKTAISRLESGNQNLSLEYIERIAKVFNKKVHINFS